MIKIYDDDDLEKYYSKNCKQYMFDNDITIDSCFVADLGDEDIHVNGDVFVECSLLGREIRARNIYAYNINFDNIIANKIKAKKIIGFNIYANYIECEDIDYHYTCIATQELHYKKIKYGCRYPCHICLKDLNIEYKIKNVCHWDT